MEDTSRTKDNGSSFELVASMEPGQMDDDFGSGWKICTHCNDEKPLVEFHLDKSGVYGRRSWCKLCENEKRRKVKPAKENNMRHDRIDRALEAAAYRIIKESM